MTLSAWAWDPENDLPLTYQWKIDGANQSTNSEFVWVAIAGTPTVELVVTDSKGKSSTSTQTISVATNNSLPVIYYTSAEAALLCNDIPTLYASVYDPDGDPLTYSWRENAVNGSDITGTLTNGIFTPTVAPNGDVLLTVSDGKGSVSQSISVPAADKLTLYVAEALPLTQTVDMAVELYAYAYSTATEGVTYQWVVTAPNGNLVTTEPKTTGATDWVTFTPTQIGDYTITMTAEDGCSFEERTMTVKVNPKEVSSLAGLYGNQQIIVNQPVNINMAVLNLPAITTFELKDLTQLGAMLNGTTLTPIWTPTIEGTHTLELTVSYPIILGIPPVKKTLNVLVNPPVPTTVNGYIQ